MLVIHPQLLLRQRPREGVGRVVIVDGQYLAVQLHGLILVAALLVSLRQQDKDERVFLVCLFQFVNCGLVVAVVVGYIPRQIRIETLLVLRHFTFIERYLRELRFFIGFNFLPVPCCDASFGTLITELPQVLVCLRKTRRVHGSGVAGLVPLGGSMGVAALQGDARQLVHGCRRIEILLGLHLCFVGLLLVVGDEGQIAGKGVGNGERAKRLDAAIGRSRFQRLL